MDGLTIAVRTVHYTALMALFGELVFYLWVARPVERIASLALADARYASGQRRLRLSFGWLLVVILSGVLWLLAQAAEMSGLSLGGALNPGTLSAVLAQTLFGHVWGVRFGLAVALGGLLLLLARRGVVPERMTMSACALLAAGMLASLVYVGHANAERGMDRVLHQCADATHLLAAGAWLGALAPLVSLLRWCRRAAGGRGLAVAGQAVRRFSLLGMISVGAILVTGIVNTWYTAGTVPALLGTHYGHLLLVKLGLFGAMTALAAFNRTRLTPRIADGASIAVQATALGKLMRNARAEAMCGVAVLALVGSLGVAVPALHAQIDWPLPYTLDWDAKRFVRAYPTTYRTSPVGYTAESIARGALLYSQHCAVCHGLAGKGDGPAAATGAGLKPADLTEHFHYHREGDILWWIEHGVPGTPMPAFADRLSEGQGWDVVNALRALADAQRAGSTHDPVISAEIPAPDFAIQIGGNPQENLLQISGRHNVLLIFYSLPGSVARLRALSACRATLERANLRVIAVPIREIDQAPVPGIDSTYLAHPAPQVAVAYFTLAHGVDQISRMSEPMEFLVDRHGNLRGRWANRDHVDCDHIPMLLEQVSRTSSASSPVPRRREHVH